ncbi:hypothetical protein [Bdellovibrio bacteriovorus]|uniref:hypothetical protein n=1 Tax=Bdellovibrio bacteriovorus TaxID=959 RepID=UPI0035A61D5C
MNKIVNRTILASYFLYVLVCFLLAIKYPVHAFSLEEYVSSHYAQLFWIILSLIFWGFALLQGYLIYKNEKGLLSLEKVIKFTSLRFLFFSIFVVSSLQFFDFINSFRVYDAENRIVLTGRIIAKKVERCTKFKDCYYLSIDFGDHKESHHQVESSSYYGVKPGDEIKMNYVMGRLGVKFQNGDLTEVSR